MHFGRISFFIVCLLWPATALALDAAEFKQIVDTMIRLCMGGGHIESKSGTGAGGAEVSLKSLDARSQVKGEISISRSNAEGLVNGLDNAMTNIAANEADKVRDCLKDDRARLLDVMLPLNEKPKPITAKPNLDVVTETGEDAVDKVYAGLSNLSNPVSEGELSKILAQFFSRPVFDHIGEADDPSDALYVFFKGQLILEKHIDDFGSPATRRSVRQATENMIYLQDEVGSRVYGTNFKRSEMCRKHSETLTSYRDKLPVLVGDVRDQPAKIGKILAVARKNLFEAGLRDAP
jgi:hypothetical protein